MGARCAVGPDLRYALAMAAVHFTQPGAVMREDSMDRWRMQASLLTGEVALQSWDYRTLDRRTANAGGAGDSGISLAARDVPGAYAYTSREHGQRLAERRLQALDVARANVTGAGTVRTMAPATRFALLGEPVTGDSGDFIAVRVLHLMHNNLAAQMRSNIQRELGHAALQLLNVMPWKRNTSKMESSEKALPPGSQRNDQI